MALVAQADDSTGGRFQKVTPKFFSKSQSPQVLLGIAKVCIVASLVASVLIFSVKIFKNHEKALPVLDLCLVLLVASIPITMQVVCTGTLAVGSRRLAEHNVVVSRLGAIEELAGMTVLCSDKTGTLTQNKLQMREPWILNNAVDANEIIFNSALASKRVNPDAIDFCVINGNG
jgi:H+-transporting ATPase